MVGQDACVEEAGRCRNEARTTVRTCGGLLLGGSAVLLLVCGSLLFTSVLLSVRSLR